MRELTIYTVEQVEVTRTWLISVANKFDAEEVDMDEFLTEKREAGKAVEYERVEDSNGEEISDYELEDIE